MEVWIGDGIGVLWVLDVVGWSLDVGFKVVILEVSQDWRRNHEVFFCEENRRERLKENGGDRAEEEGTFF